MEVVLLRDPVPESVLSRTSSSKVFCAARMRRNIGPRSRLREEIVWRPRI
jgi:hypothetical protein